MSPLLTISLAIVISLWAIPLTWAFLAGVGALTRWIQTALRPLPLLSDVTEDERRPMYAEVLSKDEYQMLKDEVIRRRALIALAIDVKPQLKEKIRELTLTLQELELSPGESTAAQRLKEHGIREQLASCQREFEEIDPKLASLRCELEEKEHELKKVSPKNQVLYFKPRADAASKRIGDDRTDTPVEKRIRRMELALKKREVQISEKPVCYMPLVKYQELFDFLEGASKDMGDSKDLKQLVRSTKETIQQIYTTLQYRNTDKEFLITQLATSETETESCRRKATDAMHEGNPGLVKQAKDKQIEYEALSSKYRSLLDEFKNQTLELVEFEKKFFRSKEELLMKIAELESEPMDFHPDE